jgi:acyl-CoA reductase-like NAD-dependent aldehyde dehydrogenase
MRIDHLIDGKAVASSQTFETRDPATQEVLAEVSSGGADEVNQAVASAKAAFPKWAVTPAPAIANTAARAKPFGCIALRHFLLFINSLLNELL